MVAQPLKTDRVEIAGTLGDDDARSVAMVVTREPRGPGWVFDSSAIAILLIEC